MASFVRSVVGRVSERGVVSGTPLNRPVITRMPSDYRSRPIPAYFLPTSHPPSAHLLPTFCFLSASYLRKKRQITAPRCPQLRNLYPSQPYRSQPVPLTLISGPYFCVIGDIYSAQTVSFYAGRPRRLPATDHPQQTHLCEGPCSSESTWDSPLQGPVPIAVRSVRVTHAESAAGLSGHSCLPRLRASSRPAPAITSAADTATMIAMDEPVLAMLPTYVV